MLVRSYGLFWREDEVEWEPGSGGTFMMVGRHGSISPKLRVVDFRRQTGVYVLYGNHGPVYVGLAESKGGLGSRLRAHRADEYAGYWDRFSWFGFCGVTKDQDERGFHMLELIDIERAKLGKATDAIHDLEAILIKALGVRNKRDMNLTDAIEWTQIKLDEHENYFRRVRP